MLELYDEAEAINVSPANPGFDNLLGEPYLEDTTGDGVGERVRPGNVVEVKAKAEFTKHEEQEQDQAGNAPDSFLTLTMFTPMLESMGLLVNGVYGIRPNDRLLRLESSTGKVRVDFEQNERDGLFVFEVRPGPTGSRTLQVLLEKRRPVAR